MNTKADVTTLQKAEMTTTLRLTEKEHKVAKKRASELRVSLNDYYRIAIDFLNNNVKLTNKVNKNGQ